MCGVARAHIPALVAAVSLIDNTPGSDFILDGLDYQLTLNFSHYQGLLLYHWVLIVLLRYYPI